MRELHSESYLHKKIGFNPIIMYIGKKESEFFFNHKLHKINRKLQLQILLTEKYPGLKPRINHITTSSPKYTT